MATLPLEDIVNIIVNLSPRSAIRKGFNIGLIIGNSGVISGSDRVKLYADLDGMAADGFTSDMPEYRAARLYFSQRPKPRRVAIGAMMPGLSEITVITTADTATLENYIVTVDNTLTSGNSYVYQTSSTQISVPNYNDVLTTVWTAISSGDSIPASSDDYIMLAEIDADNKVKKVGMAQFDGSGVPLNIPPAETALQAVVACRNVSSSWYMVTVCGAERDDIISISEYIETAAPSSVYAFTYCDIAKSDPSAAYTNIFDMLKKMGMRRTIGQCSQTPDAIAGIMGYAMGANTRLSSSAYTLMHKAVVGLIPDDFDVNTVTLLANCNANYYVARGDDADYSMFENGVMCDGVYFDEIINLDMLVNDMQLAILDLLRSRPKIAQTEGGVNQIKLAMKPSLEKARLIGFIAPGLWRGAPIWLTPDHLALDTDDMLDTGYRILSEPVYAQSQADRDNRLAPPIYVPIKLAGAIHHVTVQIDVNR